MLEVLEWLKSTGSRLEGMLYQLKWPPPGHLSAALLDHISHSFEKGQLTTQDVDEIFVHFYDKDKLKKLVEGWSQRDFIQPRMKILKEAVAAHVEGRYELSIPTLLPQIEGTIADINKHAGRMKFKNMEDYVESIFARNSRFDRISKAFYLSILLENFKWQDPIPFLSRHAILHGTDTNYASASNSLRLILMFDRLQDSMKLTKMKTG